VIDSFIYCGNQSSGIKIEKSAGKCKTGKKIKYLKKYQKTGFSTRYGLFADRCLIIKSYNDG
jgi:hypothetical protein